MSKRKISVVIVAVLFVAVAHLAFGSFFTQYVEARTLSENTDGCYESVAFKSYSVSTPVFLGISIIPYRVVRFLSIKGLCDSYMDYPSGERIRNISMSDSEKLLFGWCSHTLRAEIVRPADADMRVGKN